MEEVIRRARTYERMVREGGWTRDMIDSTSRRISNVADPSIIFLNLRIAPEWI